MAGGTVLVRNFAAVSNPELPNAEQATGARKRGKALETLATEDAEVNADRVLEKLAEKKSEKKNTSTAWVVEEKEI